MTRSENAIVNLIVSLGLAFVVMAILNSFETIEKGIYENNIRKRYKNKT